MINDNYINDFTAELQEYNCVAAMTSTCVSDCLDVYVTKFSNIYNKYFPIKTFLIKDKYSNKPQITQGLRKSIKQRNRLQKLHKMAINLQCIIKKI